MDYLVSLMDMFGDTQHLDLEEKNLGPKIPIASADPRLCRKWAKAPVSACFGRLTWNHIGTIWNFHGTGTIGCNIWSDAE